MIIIPLTSPLPNTRLPLKWPTAGEILPDITTVTQCPPVEDGERDSIPDGRTGESYASVMSTDWATDCSMNDCWVTHHPKHQWPKTVILLLELMVLWVDQAGLSFYYSSRVESSTLCGINWHHSLLFIWPLLWSGGSKIAVRKCLDGWKARLSGSSLSVWCQGLCRWPLCQDLLQGSSGLLESLFWARK